VRATVRLQHTDRARCCWSSWTRLVADSAKVPRGAETRPRLAAYTCIDTSVNVCPRVHWKTNPAAHHGQNTACRRDTLDRRLLPTCRRCSRTVPSADTDPACRTARAAHITRCAPSALCPSLPLPLIPSRSLPILKMSLCRHPDSTTAQSASAARTRELHTVPSAALRGHEALHELPTKPALHSHTPDAEHRPWPEHGRPAMPKGHAVVEHWTNQSHSASTADMADVPALPREQSALK
jgi:hypothetical protein